MSRFSRDELVDKALLALREAADEVDRRAGPVGRSAALRFALAFLANDQADRAAFDQFWNAATEPAGEREGPAHRNSAQHFGRLQTLNNACKFIHRLHGRAVD